MSNDQTLRTFWKPKRVEMYAHGLNTCSAGVYGLNTYSCRRVICQRYLLNNRILLGPCFPLILCGFDQVVLFVLMFLCSLICLCGSLGSVFSGFVWLSTSICFTVACCLLLLVILCFCVVGLWHAKLYAFRLQMTSRRSGCYRVFVFLCKSLRWN